MTYEPPLRPPDRDLADRDHPRRLMHPVPDRLEPLRREVHLIEGVRTMLAVIAAILAVLAGLDVTVGALSPFDLLAFAVAALALHFVWTVALPVRRA